MANIQKAREVPDSEDERMSSSPVDLANVMPDKLSATVPVPHQEVQDAPLRDACHHQDSAETIANDAGESTDALDAGLEKASLDIVSLQDAHSSSLHQDAPFADTESPDADLPPQNIASEAGLPTMDASGETSAAYISEAPEKQTELRACENVQPNMQDVQSPGKPKVSVMDVNYNAASLQEAAYDTEHLKSASEGSNRPTNIVQNEHDVNVSRIIPDVQLQASPHMYYVHNALVRAKSEQNHAQDPALSSSSEFHIEAQTARNIRSSSLPLEADPANVDTIDILDTSKVQFSVCLN